MKKLKFLVSLTNDDNDYQIEQSDSAQQAAAKAGVDVQIIHAQNDAITQSTQLLKAVQAPKDLRPDGILFEPVGVTAAPGAFGTGAAGVWAAALRARPEASNAATAEKRFIRSKTPSGTSGWTPARRTA